MSKGRKPPTQHQAPPQTHGERAPEATLDEELLGNQALQRQLGGPGPIADSDVRATAAELGYRTALSLRVPPRDPAWSERLVELVERSQLPEARREAVADRLLADQATADTVARAVEQWLGRDEPALRSALVAAFDEGARDVAGAPVPEGATLAERAEALLAEAAAARVPDASPEALTGLCRSLALLVELVWDEEEEEAPPGDYAAEESGF